MTTTAPITMIRALTISGDLNLQSSINECISIKSTTEQVFCYPHSLLIILKHKMKCCLECIPSSPQLFDLSSKCCKKL